MVSETKLLEFFWGVKVLKAIGRNNHYEVEILKTYVGIWGKRNKIFWPEKGENYCSCKLFTSKQETEKNFKKLMNISEDKDMVKMIFEN